MSLKLVKNLTETRQTIQENTGNEGIQKALTKEAGVVHQRVQNETGGKSEKKIEEINKILEKIGAESMSSNDQASIQTIGSILGELTQNLEELLWQLEKEYKKKFIFSSKNTIMGLEDQIKRSIEVLKYGKKIINIKQEKILFKDQDYIRAMKDSYNNSNAETRSAKIGEIEQEIRNRDPETKTILEKADQAVQAAYKMEKDLQAENARAEMLKREREESEKAKRIKEKEEEKVLAEEEKRKKQIRDAEMRAKNAEVAEKEARKKLAVAENETRNAEARAEIAEQDKKKAIEELERLKRQNAEDVQVHESVVKVAEEAKTGAEEREKTARKELEEMKEKVTEAELATAEVRKELQEAKERADKAEREKDTAIEELRKIEEDLQKMLEEELSTAEGKLQ